MRTCCVYLPVLRTQVTLRTMPKKGKSAPTAVTASNTSTKTKASPVKINSTKTKTNSKKKAPAKQDTGTATKTQTHTGTDRPSSDAAEIRSTTVNIPQPCSTSSDSRTSTHETQSKVSTPKQAVFISKKPSAPQSLGVTLRSQSNPKPKDEELKSSESTSSSSSDSTLQVASTTTEIGQSGIRIFLYLFWTFKICTYLYQSTNVLFA